jgi:hypothetical protein
LLFRTKTAPCAVSVRPALPQFAVDEVGVDRARVETVFHGDVVARRNMVFVGHGAVPRTASV